MTRREFVRAGLGISPLLAPRWIPLGLGGKAREPLRMAVITDLHHGLAPDAMTRLEAFAAQVRRRKGIDLVMQMGDFCYSQPESADFAKLFRELPHPKIHVLGNHDMDKCDKDHAMRYWGMKSRFGTYDFGDYRFVILDLNNFIKNGKMTPYANGNYFTDNASFNRADPEQLEWLKEELHHSAKPVVLISHQPLGFAEPGQPMPPEQVEILDIVNKAKAANPRGAVAVSMFGHLHVDRLERVEGIPYYCVNSASYFWGGAMYPYSKPLFAFMELSPDGFLKVEGLASSFLKNPPASTDAVIGRSASIINRNVAVSVV